ncbi:MAG: hypothetical protein IKW83_07440 [Muribaculaceae bacterium]|nr:hypothetical protein [Muribaculaceae bacterium]
MPHDEATVGRCDKKPIIDIRTLTRNCLGKHDTDDKAKTLGLDVSKDGKTVIVTSQGHTSNGRTMGGMAVNIYQVEYAEPEPLIVEKETSDSIATTPQGGNAAQDQESTTSWMGTTKGKVTTFAIAAVLIAAVSIVIKKISRKK